MKLPSPFIIKFFVFSGLLIGHSLLIAIAVKRDDYFSVISNMVFMAIILVLILMELVLESQLAKRCMYGIWAVILIVGLLYQNKIFIF